MRASPSSEFACAWRVIVAAAVGVGLGTTGLPIYTTGQFILPLRSAFGWSRSATEGALICLTVGGIMMSPVIGTLTDRFGVRRVALASQLGLCLGYLGLTLNGGSLLAYYVGWAVLSVLGAGTSPIVWTTAVASWFEHNRGLALGLTLCGTGIVAIIGPGITGGLIAAYGWRAGFIALAAAQLLIGWPLTAALLKTRDQPVPTLAAPVSAEGATVHEATRSSRFWRMLAAFALIAITVGGLIVNLPAILADHGLAPAQAGRALGLLGFALIAGRLTIGWLLDRVPARFVAPAYILLPAVSCLLLAQGGAQGGAPLLGILLIGLATGAEVDLLPYLVSRVFGMRHYSKLYGWLLGAFGAGVGIGPAFAGWIRDQTGTYNPALAAFAFMTAVAASLIATLRTPRPVAAH
jgi:MFS family permease